MSIKVDSPPSVVSAEEAFSAYNRDFQAKSCERSRYSALEEEAPVSGVLFDIVTSLEIESFISPREAILLKNNLHDASTGCDT